MVPTRLPTPGDLGWAHWWARRKGMPPTSTHRTTNVPSLADSLFCKADWMEPKMSSFGCGLVAGMAAVAVAAP